MIIGYSYSFTTGSPKAATQVPTESTDSNMCGYQHQCYYQALQAEPRLHLGELARHLSWEQQPYNLQLRISTKELYRDSYGRINGVVATTELSWICIEKSPFK